MPNALQTISRKTCNNIQQQTKGHLVEIEQEPQTKERKKESNKAYP